jgi:hypothetical protein
MIERAATLVERTLTAALIAACIGMVVLVALLWAGYLVTDEHGSHEAAVPRVTDAPGAEATPAGAVLTNRSEPVTVKLWAVRGPCWMSVRLGSPDGKRLFLGTLRRGRSLEFTGERIWMRIGAAENLVASRNGRRIENFPQGVAELTITSDRISRI